MSTCSQVDAPGRRDSRNQDWDGSYELTAMDKAQLWLYSNPLIRSGMSLDEIRGMARYGEWR